MHVLAVTALDSQILYPPIGTLLFALLVLACAVGWLVVLVSALRVHDDVWTATGQSRVGWVLVIIFLGILGALLYVAIARPSLRRVRVQAR